MPQSLPTFLVDGTVAGTWRYEDGRVVLDPWRELGDTAALEQEAAALARYLGAP
jgi:Winged helix DNA-binding domain